MKLAAQGDHGQLRHRGGELHTCGTATDKDKGHLTRSFGIIVCGVRQFICAQNFRPDGFSVAEVLKAWRKCGKLVTAEIARLHPEAIIK
jgi:hypothetical protein